MPKKIDDERKARAVRLVQGHRGEYSSLTAAAAVVAKQLGVGKESVRRWALQAEIDGRLTALTRGVRVVPAGLGDKLGDYAALALVDD